MKKILVCVMILALCLCATVSSFAADAKGLQPDQSASGDVNITVNGEPTHVYSVDVTFNNAEFTYSVGMIWDPDNYVYKPATEHEWSGEGTVTIINHSDLPVNYTVESTVDTTEFGTLSINVVDKGNETGTKGTIAKCNVGDVKYSHKASATYTVSGTPTVSEITAQKLGSITVTISKSN